MIHKAWCVQSRGDDECLYLLASSSSKAKAAVHRSEYNEGGWYLDFTVKRVPALDYDDEAKPGEPHEEPLTFFSLHKAGLMRMDCAVCGTKVEGSCQWSNGWTVFCRDHWQQEEPYLRRDQSWYQPVDPKNPMIWVGEWE